MIGGADVQYVKQIGPNKSYIKIKWGATQFQYNSTFSKIYLSWSFSTWPLPHCMEQLRWLTTPVTTERKMSGHGPLLQIFKQKTEVSFSSHHVCFTTRYWTILFQNKRNRQHKRQWNHTKLLIEENEAASSVHKTLNNHVGSCPIFVRVHLAENPFATIPVGLIWSHNWNVWEKNAVFCEWCVESMIQALPSLSHFHAHCCFLWMILLPYPLLHSE